MIDPQDEQSGPRTIAVPRRRAPRRLVSVSPRPERTIAILAALIIGAIFAGYDVAGIRELNHNPVTGVDYLPVVEYVAARRESGQTVLVALPPPAFLAFESTDDLIFLSSPITRKRAQRYTRLTEDGTYADYWTGVDSIVDTAGLCRLLTSDTNLLLIIDDARLDADWAYSGSMATVIRGMTYIRYQAEGGAMVRGVSPLPSRTTRAEELCAQALTGEIIESDPSDDEPISEEPLIDDEPTEQP